MKRGSRAALWTALGLILAGIIICALGFAQSNWGGMREMGIWKTELRSYAAEHVDSVYLDVRNVKVRLLPAEDGKVSIYYRDRPEAPLYTFSEDGGALRMEYGAQESWESIGWIPRLLGLWGGNLGEITVYLPSDMAGALDIRTTNAQVELSDIRTLGSARLQTKNGKIQCRNVDVRTEIELEATNGVLALEHLRAGGHISARTTNGKLSIQDTLAGELRLHTTNAAMELANTSAQQTFSAETTNGVIRVDEIAGQDISLRSTNGKISGTVAGSASEYSVDISTTNGSASPANRQGGARSLEVRTTNAHVDISFSEK